jgi:hypothetical protein
MGDVRLSRAMILPRLCNQLQEDPSHGLLQAAQLTMGDGQLVSTNVLEL